jgi:hypothetical protein
MDTPIKLQHNLLLWAGVCASVALCAVARPGFADNFAQAYYDASTDELVVTMRYSGTNPNHKFAIQWGQCSAPKEGSSAQQVDATITDDQWKDAARKPFKKVVRFSLAQLACRPASLTLHTAPRFYYTLQIPAPH